MTHIGFPLRLDARGRAAVADRDAWIAGLIEQVLVTRPGERVNRPDFGAGLADLVFEPTDAGLRDATPDRVIAQERADQMRVEMIAIAGVEREILRRQRCAAVGDQPAVEKERIRVCRNVMAGPTRMSTGVKPRLGMQVDIAGERMNIVAEPRRARPAGRCTERSPTWLHA